MNRCVHIRRRGMIDIHLRFVDKDVKITDYRYRAAFEFHCNLNRKTFQKKEKKPTL